MLMDLSGPLELYMGYRCLENPVSEMDNIQHMQQLVTLAND